MARVCERRFEFRCLTHGFAPQPRRGAVKTDIYALHMTGADLFENCADDGFIETLVEICRETASIVFEGVGIVQLDEADSDASPALQEKALFENAYDAPDDETLHPPFWMALIGSTYLPEAGHLCLSLAAQLRARTFVVGVQSDVRAVAERVARLDWIFDPACATHQRFARAGLEMTVCQQFYRQTIEQLKAPKVDQKKARARHVELRESLTRYFTHVVKPLLDPDDPESHTPDATAWLVDGEAYLTYSTIVARLAELLGKSANGTYGAYSGLTHPNVQFAQEHRRFTEDGSVAFFYPCEDLEKSVRAACFMTLHAMRLLVSYNGGDLATLQARIDKLSDWLDTISVLAVPIDAEQT